MQNFVIRYVEDLKAILEPTGCSINAAIEKTLPTYDRLRLFKLIAAADDLRRILELELQRREEAREITDATVLLRERVDSEDDPSFADTVLLNAALHLEGRRVDFRSGPIPAEFLDEVLGQGRR